MHEVGEIKGDGVLIDKLKRQAGLSDVEPRPTFCSASPNSEHAREEIARRLLVAQHPIGL